MPRASTVWSAISLRNLFLDRPRCVQLDGRIIGAMLGNAICKCRPLERLIKGRTAVDAAQLADIGVALKQLAV